MGVCIDTAHAYSAGYDLKNEAAFNKVFGDFDKIVGRKYLMGMHLNESKKTLGSRVDRHDSLGKGTLGTGPFLFSMKDARFDNMPLILETPDPDLWAEEIATLKKMQF